MSNQAEPPYSLRSCRLLPLLTPLVTSAPLPSTGPPETMSAVLTTAPLPAALGVAPTTSLAPIALAAKPTTPLTPPFSTGLLFHMPSASYSRQLKRPTTPATAVRPEYAALLDAKDTEIQALRVQPHASFGPPPNLHHQVLTLGPLPPVSPSTSIPIQSYPAYLGSIPQVLQVPQLPHLAPFSVPPVASHPPPHHEHPPPSTSFPPLPSVVLQRPSNLPTFSGSSDKDIDDWLNQLELLSSVHNTPDWHMARLLPALLAHDSPAHNWFFHLDTQMARLWTSVDWQH
ncbi:hypothetical protein DFS34DRAFT_647320 [Phlyctochytrium arcticum]|nr:hypothetical protein DFS34DRAFT_647320 [Phlyctochytrium arcticum]